MFFDMSFTFLTQQWLTLKATITADLKPFN